MNQLIPTIFMMFLLLVLFTFVVFVTGILKVRVENGIIPIFQISYPQ